MRHLLIDIETRESVHIEFRKGHRKHIVNDFWWAGLHWQGSPDMRAVERHSSCVILRGIGGSLERMKHLMTAASAVVRAGALGVHVEHVGIAHAPQVWLELSNDGLDGILRAFVITIDGAVSGAYSCGMHSFGLKEVSVPTDVPNRASLVGTITRHLLVKGARIARGQTIAIGGKSVRYRFWDVQSAAAPDGAVFEHQIGTWQLLRAEAIH
ncbi:hypothetical protein [Cupriavidus necator]